MKKIKYRLISIKNLPDSTTHYYVQKYERMFLFGDWTTVYCTGNKEVAVDRFKWFAAGNDEIKVLYES